MCIRDSYCNSSKLRCSVDHDSGNGKYQAGAAKSPNDTISERLNVIRLVCRVLPRLCSCRLLKLRIMVDYFVIFSVWPLRTYFNYRTDWNKIIGQVVCINRILSDWVFDMLVYELSDVAILTKCISQGSVATYSSCAGIAWSLYDSWAELLVV